MQTQTTITEKQINPSFHGVLANSAGQLSIYWDSLSFQSGRWLLEGGICKEKLIGSAKPRVYSLTAGRVHSWPIAQSKTQQYFIHTVFPLGWCHKYLLVFFFDVGYRCREVKTQKKGESFLSIWEEQKIAIWSTASYSSINMAVVTSTHSVLLHQMGKFIKLEWTQASAFKEHGDDLSFPSIFSSLTYFVVAYYALTRLHWDFPSPACFCSEVLI